MPNNNAVSTVVTFAEQVIERYSPAATSEANLSPALIDALTRVWRQLEPYVDFYPGLEPVGKLIKLLGAKQSATS